jgi:hypothetical protein
MPEGPQRLAGQGPSVAVAEKTTLSRVGAGQRSSTSIWSTIDQPASGATGAPLGAGRALDRLLQAAAGHDVAGFEEQRIYLPSASDLGRTDLL